MPFITPPRGAAGAAGATYTAPITRERLSGNAVTVAAGNSGNITWNTSNGPSSLLDVTNPATPVIVTTGVYAVAISVYPDALPTPGSCRLRLLLDLNGEDVEVATDFAGYNASLACAYYLPAGAVIVADAANGELATSHTFTLQVGSVQRLS